MSTEGIEALFLETHNWGKTAKFLQALGFTLDFETDHNSGQLRHGNGPYVFVAEIPADRQPQVQVALRVADARYLPARPGPRRHLVRHRHPLRHPRDARP